MRFFIIIVISFALLQTAANASIEKIQLISHEEFDLNADEIIHLPGLGLGLRCRNDSIMLLDDPQLAGFTFSEPIDARSIISVRSGIYVANGDSIFRMATGESKHEYVGRMDNETFRLYQATDSSFYACTADEEFSCVYEIFPEDKTCEPIISIEAPILKIESNGANTMMWVDDTILRLHDEGFVENIYQADNITDMSLTPIGVMVGTTDGVYWLTGPDKGAKIIKEPVKGLWWDNSDALYYLAATGDLIAVMGIRESYTKYRDQSTE